MTTLVAKAEMLIRCTPEDAFDAFINPAKITQFWLDATSGPLAKGAKVSWTFLVPGATETVAVTEFHAPSRLGFEWSDGVNVLLTFHPHADERVRVSVVATGFDTDRGVEGVVDATEGFTIVLCDLKTWLESGRSANLVRDKATLIAASLD